MDHITSLHSALPDDATPPKLVHLVAAGTVYGVDGRGPYTLGDADAVIRASMAAGKLPIDEMHATDHGRVNGTPAPARGWIVGMHSRADGLWGDVEWTPAGAALMSERAYRGLSPVITHSTDGRISSVLRAGLTNVPNLTLTSLHNQGPSMDLNRLREALGLPATADEAAILAAASAARDAVSAHNAALSRIATAVGIAADAKPDVIITSLQSQRAAAGSVDTMAREMVALQTQVQGLQSTQAREKATAVIDGAMRDGNPEQFVWIVGLPTARVSKFRCGVSRCGDPLGKIERNTQIECVIRRVAPTHTLPVFQYATAPGPGIAIWDAFDWDDGSLWG